MLLDDQKTQVNTGNVPEKSNIATLRQYLKNGFLALKTDFLKTPNNTRLFKQHCKLIDSLLVSIWEQANIDKCCCLIAVGGYGRGELYPYSDIDLLILIPEFDDLQVSASINAKLEALVGLLWDIGLNVGHSVRSLSECIQEAKKDITVQTNLIESRLITGDNNFYEDFLSGINHTFNSPTAIANFFVAKLKEQNNRHAKFNDTAYNLEPNIKESPGGLRDLHMILWIAQSLNMASSRPSSTNHIWKLLTKQNVVSALEARQIQQHQSNLQLLRIRLHFISKRREDRLLFDFQNELADSLGYTNTPRKRASEQLMQSYYRSVKFVSLMNEILLKSFQQIVAVNPPAIKSINAHFESHDQLLEAKTAGLLQQEPSAIFEAFLLLQQHPELDGMGATLLRNMQRVKRLVNRDFRQNFANKKLFIEIISQPSGVNHALRAMNRYGILGSYIPAFGKIIGQMQHDLFHVYTVDEHILNVLANLRRFAKSELKHEFPLCSRLFAEFDAPHLLYLAALFHDIAKGRGGDHSTLGTVDAVKFCKLHGLSKADSALVAWLVAAHLQMSSTAQKSDLSDPSVIETFSHYVQNERRLVALYLLTVADIRGTSPLVWNAWKSRLLESLFNATKHALANQLLYVEQAITTRKYEAAERLNKFGLSKHSYEHLWEKFGSNYFIRHESDEIAWHSRLLTPHLNATQAIVRARLSPNGDGIQVMIYSKDQNDLFARICNFFDRMGYNIVEAKIYTTDHAYALDSFIVLDQSGKSVSYSGLLKFIEVELTQKLDKTQALESPLKGRISRQVKHMPILAQVTITQEADNNNHKLDIIANDRPGLLASLAHQFLVLEIELHNAKINTLGNRAEDTFLISATKGQKLDALSIIALKEAIASEI
jgi:[protein-PII] uridylyltransferase